jgi:hypothetical protein
MTDYDLTGVEGLVVVTESLIPTNVLPNGKVGKLYRVTK